MLKNNGQSDLPFRLIGIVPDVESALYFIDRISQVEDVGCALMLRDPAHRSDHVVQMLDALASLQRPANLTVIPQLVTSESWGHFPQAMVPELDQTVRKEPFLFGLSVHSAEEIDVAEEFGPTYLLLSPVFQTRSKPDAEPIGVERFSRLVRRTTRPVFGLGGCDSSERVQQIMKAGAAGVAGLSFAAPGNETLLNDVIHGLTAFLNQPPDYRTTENR